VLTDDVEGLSKRGLIMLGPPCSAAGAQSKMMARRRDRLYGADTGMVGATIVRMAMGSAN
jgi:hypothetical protein